MSTVRLEKFCIHEANESDFVIMQEKIDLPYVTQQQDHMISIMNVRGFAYYPKHQITKEPQFEHLYVRPFSVWKLPNGSSIFLCLDMRKPKHREMLEKMFNNNPKLNC